MEFVVFAEGRIDDFLQGSWVDLDHLDQLAECHPHLACQQFNMPPQLRLVGQYHPFLLHHHHHHCHQNANNTNANPTHVLSHKSQGIPCNWSGTMNKKGLPISYPVHFEQTSYVYHHIFGCTPNLLYKMRTVNTKQY